MASKTLVNYIKQQLQRGYDIQTIKSYLIKYGYNLSDVDDAVRNIYNPEVRHVIHFSPTTLISIAVIFIGIISLSFFFYNLISSGTPEALLDLELKSLKSTVNSGQNVAFTAELDNLGSSRRFDVSLRYELINLKTSKVVTFKEETRAIETKSSKQIEMEVPQDAEKGDYVLRAIAIYNGERAVATLPIKIESANVQEEEQQNQEPIEQPIEEIQEKEIADKPIETNEDETAGSEALTTFETLEKVGSIAAQDAKEAESLCKKLELQTSKDLCFNKIGEVLGDRTYCALIADERTKDVCLSNVAKLVGKSEICQEIAKESRRDSCYMNFVVDKKDYTVCDKVANQYLKQSCESLKQLSQLNITDVAFYETLINQSLVQLT